MINIVIIGRNESDYIIKMKESLEKMLPNAKRIWVIDRCKDDSKKILKNLGEFFVKTPFYKFGRQTSYSRNLGLKYCDKNSDVLFLDGDRYPLYGELENLEYSNTDIKLLKLNEDTREEVLYNSYGKVLNNFFSCGIFFKRNAINKILKFQKGELFKISMQKYWGIEDVFLGDVCYHLNLTCSYYNNCRLRGSFNKLSYDTPKVIVKRFKERAKLNVLW